MIVDDYWKPTVASGLVMCDGQRPVRPEGFFDMAPSTEPSDGVLQSPPTSITGPTLIIWVRKDCIVCQINKPYFTQLEERLQKRMKVVRVEASNENLAGRYKHVTALPTFDVVTTSSDSHSPYGAGTKLESMPNYERERLEKALSAYS